jgi:hypothetical protein
LDDKGIGKTTAEGAWRGIWLEGEGASRENSEDG